VGEAGLCGMVAVVVVRSAALPRRAEEELAGVVYCMLRAVRWPGR